MTLNENNNFSFHLIYLADSWAKSIKILVRTSQGFEAVITNKASITKRCVPYPVTNTYTVGHNRICPSSSSLRKAYVFNGCNVILRFRFNIH